MNLQEKLESANKLYEDLKKGKEELDARKEIYERYVCVCMTVIVHNANTACTRWGVPAVPEYLYSTSLALRMLVHAIHCTHSCCPGVSVRSHKGVSTWLPVKEQVDSCKT